MLNYDNDSTINDTGRYYSSAFWHLTAASVTHHAQDANAVEGCPLTDTVMSIFGCCA